MNLWTPPWRRHYAAHHDWTMKPESAAMLPCRGPMPAENSATPLDRMYRRRFGGEQQFRNELWRALNEGFFQRFVPTDSVIVEIAAGGCEFINNVRARRRIAVDLNEDTREAAAPGVEVIISRSDDLRAIPSESVDIVFVSNFFEHLTRSEILSTLGEIRRVLRKGGRLLVLQPNIRYCYKEYWMFFDHITPLDDQSTVEAIELSGFRVERVIPRFLPFTTKSSLPKSVTLVRIYLRVPILWRFFGGQAFIVAVR